MPAADADRAYLAFLERQDLPTLRDWSLEVARRRRDVAFLWDLVKQLPDTHEANRDWAVYDPIDAVRELVHLVTHFREQAAAEDDEPVSGELAGLLRARYLDYLAEHAGEHRFDRPAEAGGVREG
jgi:hypothetical protein